MSVVTTDLVPLDVIPHLVPLDGALYCTVLYCTALYCTDLVPLDGAGDGDEDADGEGEVAGALQHLVHGPGVQHLGRVQGSDRDMHNMQKWCLLSPSSVDI